MVSLTKKEEKLIVSLQQKKYRKREGLFVVEGTKMVSEAIDSNFKVEYVVSSSEFTSSEIEVKRCDDITMSRMSSLKTAPGVLAVVRLPEMNTIIESDITLMTDRVQDPGNLGTIIRTADALGVKSMIVSEDTVDVFSPKVVQASMGSIFRMNFLRIDLNEFFKDKNQLLVYAAHLEGSNLYNEKVKTPCYLLMGNESQGIQESLMNLVSHKIRIPMSGEAESFNVSIASAIILSEFRRQLTHY